MKLLALIFAVLAIVGGFLFVTPQGRALWEDPLIISSKGEAMMAQMERRDAAPMAKSLAALRHGPEIAVPAVDFLSAFETRNDLRHYANAVALGDWLADAQRAIQGARLSDAEAAEFLVLLDAELIQIIPVELQTDLDAARQSFVADVRSGNTSMTGAIELFAYGDINASDLTALITGRLDN